VHLVGFVINKFVTMRGHMNVVEFMEKWKFVPIYVMKAPRGKSGLDPLILNLGARRR
jgi:hypothetical protein